MVEAIDLFLKIRIDKCTAENTIANNKVTANLLAVINEVIVINKAELSLRHKEELSCSAQDRSILICNVFPALISKLMKSDEFKASVAEAFNMNFDAAWMKSVRVSRKEEQTVGIIAKAVKKGLDVNAEAKALELFEGLSDIKYPIVQKVVESSSMNVEELMALCPDPYLEVTPSLNPKFRPNSNPKGVFKS